MLLPAGIEQPTRAVYPSLDEPGCCWLGPSAAFSVERSAGADRLMVDFVLPPYAVGPQPTVLTLTALGRTQRACCFGAGEHQAAFILPRGRGGRFAAVLASSSQFVPAEKGLNQDRRVLTILLKRVVTINSTTGEAYLDGSPVSANLLLPRWRVLLDAAGLVLGAGLALFLSLRRPKYAWIAVFLAAPFLLPVPVYGTTITLEKVVLVLVAVVMLAQRRFRAAIVTTPGIWILGALLLFAVEMVLSSAGATFRSAALRETLKYGEYALAFAVVYGAFVIDPDESALQRTFAWMIWGVSLLALIQPIVEPLQRTVFHGQVVPRLSGPLEGPNQLSAFLGMILVATTALSRKFSGGLLAASVLGCVTLALTISRGGILAFLLGLALVAVLKKWPQQKRTWIWATAVVGIAMLSAATLAALAFPNPALDRIFGASDAYNGGLGSRAALWHAAVLLWHRHPVLGVGPGNYELLVGSILPGVRTHPNGYFFQVLAEQGVAGIALFFLLIAAQATVFARAVPYRFANAGLGVLAVLMFHQVIDGLFPFPKVGIEFWALIAVAAASISASRTPCSS